MSSKAVKAGREISLRLDDALIHKVDTEVDAVRARTGIPVSRSHVIRQLLGEALDARRRA
jgi:Arc/MetJ-type ribon-helix-helix transcriptional regulator